MLEAYGLRYQTAAIALTLALLLSGCGGGGSSGGFNTSPPPPNGGPAPSTFKVGGTVTGLRGTGLVLQNNGTQDFGVTADGNFLFPDSVASGSGYVISVHTQPSAPSQTCVVTNASGTVQGSDALAAAVTCTTNSYPLQATVSGLLGNGLVLAIGTQSVAPTADGNFSLGSALSGSTYTVTVSSQPVAPSQTCVVQNGSGTVIADPVSTIQVHCLTNRFRLGGTATGVSGAGLILASSTGENLPIDSNGAFSFPTSVASGAAYSVTVAASPANPSQTCVLSGSSGVVQDSDVSFTVECTVNRYRVRGVLSGLLLSGLTLRLNDTHDLALTADGVFAFDQSLLSGSDFFIFVSAQPKGSPAQTCAPDVYTGTITSADAEIRVTCTTNPYSIGGTVTGLVGSQLVLRSQPGGYAAIAADGAFTFPEVVPPGTPYSIDIINRPAAPVQTCVVTNDTGVVGTAIVTVEVKCKTDRLAYFVSRETNEIHGYTINSSNGMLSGLSSGAPFATGSAPRAVAIDSSGTVLYVANCDSGNVSGFRIDEISGTLSALPGSPYVAGSQPVAIAIDAAGHYAYVANYGSNSISAYAIDPVSGALAALSGSPYAAATRPVAIALHPDVPNLYVINQGDIGLANDSLTHYAIGATGALSLASRSDYVALLSASMVFDRTGRRIYSTSLVGYQILVHEVQQDGSLSTESYTTRSPGERIALHPTAPFVFVTNTGINEHSLSVYTLDTLSGAPAEIAGSPYETGNEPNSIAFHPDGSFVYVTDLTYGGVRGYAVDVTTGSLTPIPGSPFALGASYIAVAVR